MVNIEFKKYSQMPGADRSNFNYLKIRRFVLRALRVSGISQELDFYRSSSILCFALDYFDITREVIPLTYDVSTNYYNVMIKRTPREIKDVLSDILTSLYESDQIQFQTFLGFIFKEINLKKSILTQNLYEEINALGYDYDGEILHRLSGEQPYLSCLSFGSL